MVGDQTFGALDEPAPAILYYPDTQSPGNPVTFVLRSSRAGVGTEVRRALQAALPEATVLPVRSLTEVLEQAPSMFLRRYPVFLLGVFAGFALLLAAVGIFGVVSYGVVARTREFGVRMAVGADRRDIVRWCSGETFPRCWPERRRACSARWCWRSSSGGFSSESARPTRRSWPAWSRC